MLRNTITYLLHASILQFTALVAVTIHDDDAAFILVPHGSSPDNAEKVIIPAGDSVIHDAQMKCSSS